MKLFFYIISLFLSPALFAQPSSSFDYIYDDGTGSACIPTTLNLINTSTGTITAFSWKMNDSFFSTEENPVIDIEFPGNYTICLTVIDDESTTSESCQVISFYNPPSIEINTNDTGNRCIPFQFNYSINSNVAVDSLVIDYGDGDIQYINTPEGTFFQFNHTYENAGDFILNITAYDINGCFSSQQETLTFDPIPAVDFIANATASCSIPFEVEFSNLTNPINGVDYFWDFGDGTTSTAINPTHLYVTDGNFNVKLTATNQATSCIDSLLIENFITIGNDAGDFRYEIIPNGDCGNTQVQFHNLTAGDVSSISWDFGDGNFSTEINPVHIYESAGCFTPTLNIITTSGCNSTVTAENCIDVSGPVTASYTTSQPTTACNLEEGLTVQFFGQSNLGVSYLWNFAGLGESDSQNPSFTFSEYGSYPISMTVFFPDGCAMSFVDETIVLEPLEASFEADTLSGCAPLAVTFSGTSNINEAIDSYFWDFGFETSILASPSVIYSDTGFYDVTLILTTASGCIDTFLIEDYISVGNPPEVNFEADPLVTCSEIEVQFTNESDSTAEEWLWDFGDGNTSTNFNPLHEYQDTGYFDIKLTGWHNGCPNTTSIEDYIHILPPAAIFNVNETCASFVISLENNSLGADTWEWDFGDGNTSVEWEPTHTYDQWGTYTITLVINNLLTGCRDIENFTVDIVEAVPNFELTPTLICSGDSFQVINNSTDAVSYEWIYPSEISMIPNNDLNNSPTFVADYSGTWGGFGLTITDVNDCSYTLLLEDSIDVSGLAADFSFTTGNDCLPLTVNFTDESNYILGDGNNYFWDFGDGNTSPKRNPTHTYTENGIYTISLAVKNIHGCRSSITKENIIIVGSPEANFSLEQSDCKGLQFQFNNTTISSNIATYEWDFGDGTTSIFTSPTHTFATEGEYEICLKAMTDQGCVNTFCQTINAYPLIANFNADNTYTNCSTPSLISNFTSSTIGATSWVWEFGDNTDNSILENPSHTYTQVGTYDVCLTIGNDYGCSHTLCEEMYITVDGPSGSFSTSIYEGCTDLEVSFEAQTQNVNKYTWDFGDGNTIVNTTNTSTDIVSHNYTQIGTFYPSLLIENEEGCEYLIEATEPIVVIGIEADFTMTTAEFCEGSILPINFNSTINSNEDIVDITWDFTGADMPISQEVNPSGILYQTPGTYDVSMTVTTDLCTKTITKENAIIINPMPLVDFSYNNSIPCTENIIEFVSNNTISSGSIDQLNWVIDGVSFGNDTQLNHEFNEIGSHIISLEATSALGCTTTFSDTITIQEGFHIDLPNELNLCKNQSEIIESTNTTSQSLDYNWSPSTGLSCSDCPNPTVLLDNSMTYYLTASNEFGCVYTDSIRVNVGASEAPQITLNNDTTICANEIISLSATGGASAFNYTWDSSRSGLSCYENCFNPIASPSTTTTYVLTVDNEDGCISKDSVTIEVLDGDIDVLGEDRTACEGDELSLEVLVGTNPVWMDSPNLSCLNCPNPTVQANSTSTYNIEVISPNNCRLTDEITVHVLSADSIFVGEDQQICIGDSIILNSNFEGDIIWSNEGGIIAVNEDNFAVSPSQSTTYVLSATQDACTINNEINVEVFESATIFTEEYIICEGTSTSIILEGMATNFDWESHPDLNTNDPDNIIASPETTTTFSVVGTAEGCAPDSALVTVEVVENPIIEVVNNHDFMRGDQIQIDANIQGNGNYTYNWSPDNFLSCSNCPNPIISPDNSSQYQLLVTDDFGCQDSVSISFNELLVCGDNSIVIPTAFTPNNDGENDEFFIRGTAELKLLRIFNRWGELVFESNNPDNGWDGTYKDELMNRDVFVYYVEAVCPINNQIIVKSGDITLLR